MVHFPQDNLLNTNEPKCPGPNWNLFQLTAILPDLRTQLRPSI